MELHDLRDALNRGGPALLDHPAVYPVADGSVIAPARYAGTSSGATFVTESRVVDGAFQRTVLVDSKQSQANRIEDGLMTDRREGGPASRLPTIAVDYPSQTLLDLELPHRGVDAHIRASTDDGAPTYQQAWYQAIRDATHADLSPVFVTAPAMLAFGGWDSSRARSQLRLRANVVSELFGVIDGGRDWLSRRSGARIDPLGQQFNLTPDEGQELLDRMDDEYSAKTIGKIQKEIDAARKKGGDATISGSTFNLGGVPPQTSDADGRAPAYGAAVPEVRRVRTISLAGLRRLRFGGAAEEDVAARTALLGLILLGAAYADADPDIRAYCDVGAPQARVLLDTTPTDLDLSIPSCQAFLAEAIEALPERLAWTGQQRVVVGDPGLDRGARASSDEE